jgi:ADP-ribose pyrophosphatase YjhB (NUDIX family)
MADTVEQYKNRDASQRICVRALCLHDDKILVVKRSNYGEAYIIMPGGGIDSGEDILDAAVRETMEECSVRVHALEVAKVFPAANGESEQHLVRCEYVSGTPHLDPSSEEYQRTDDGQNTYEPVWMPFSEWLESPLVRSEWKQAVEAIYHASLE